MFWNAQAYRDLTLLNLGFVGGKISIHVVTVKRSYRSNYILPTTQTHLVCDPGSWAQVLLPPFWHAESCTSTVLVWVENIFLSQCILIWVYINTSMIVSVKITPGAKIASLGLKCKLLKSHPSLMFQKVVAWPFPPHCGARYLFLSEEIKADHCSRSCMSSRHMWLPWMHALQWEKIWSWGAEKCWRKRNCISWSWRSFALPL